MDMPTQTLTPGHMAAIRENKISWRDVKADRLGAQVWILTNSRVEQRAQYTLSQENMQVGQSEYHFVATCWLKDGEAASR